MNKIKTEKYRFEIPLTELEAKKLCLLAESYGTDPSSLLSSFIADLTCSDRRDGADECMVANEWLDRAMYWPEMPYTFIHFLTSTNQIESVIMTRDLMRDARETLQKYESASGKYPGDLEVVKMAIQDWENELQEIWSEYCEMLRNESDSKSLDESLDELETWWDKTRDFLENKKAEGTEELK